MNLKLNGKAIGMNVTGVICEYNPLHAGHTAQLKRIREESGADYIIAVMSGDFVQRGEPAIYDKAVRTRAALYAGADLVIEIPVIFATASAPDFAAAGTALLDRLGIVTDLCFGSECGDLSLLSTAADILCAEPDIFKETLRDRLTSGCSYPVAQAAALTAALRAEGSQTDESVCGDIFSSPNNILGIEYLKALKLRKSPIRPFTYKREGQAYHDNSPDHIGSESYPSASAVRRAVREAALDYGSYLGTILPGESADITPSAPIYADDLSELLNAKLLELSGEYPEDRLSERLASYADFSQDLASRLSHQILSFDTFSGRCTALRNRSCTYARISRALLHIVLGITKEDTDRAKSQDFISYIRVLGFRKSADGLLSSIHKSCSLPLITKTAGAAEKLNADGCMCLSRDLYASHLYQYLVYAKSGISLKNEYTRPLIII